MEVCTLWVTLLSAWALLSDQHLGELRNELWEQKRFCPFSSGSINIASLKWTLEKHQTNNYHQEGFDIDLTPISTSFHPHSGTLVKNIGFEWMMFGIGILCFCYAPLLLLLKAPPTKEEKKVSPDGIDNSAAEVEDDQTRKKQELVVAAENLFTKL